jgi:ferredoxin-NADP reductase
MKLRITHIQALSPTIKRITLQAPDAGELANGAAGAHVILTIPGPARSWKNAYSLVSSPDDRSRYEIIVRRVAQSRGGSAWLHDHAVTGAEVEVSAPANLFPIAGLAPRHLLISAGIGITPFLAYLPVLQKKGADLEFHHACKPEDEPAFRSLLPAGQNITLHTSRNTLDLAFVLARQPITTHLYICGPGEFMDVVTTAAARHGWPASKIHTESFGGATGGAPFLVRLARSNKIIQVNTDESLLEALENAGLPAPSLCRGGACGQCELPVLDGVPDHHDHFLTPEQRASNAVILTCISRANTSELVLDF